MRSFLIFSDLFWWIFIYILKDLSEFVCVLTVKIPQWLCPLTPPLQSEFMHMVQLKSLFLLYLDENFVVWIFERKVSDVCFQSYKLKYLWGDAKEQLLLNFLSNLSSAKRNCFLEKLKMLFLWAASSPEKEKA